MRPARYSRLLLDVFVALLVGLIVVLSGCGGGGAGAGGGTTGTGAGGGLSTAAGVATVSGRVINGSTGAGVSSATVQASGISTTTLSDGSYLLTNVPSGTTIVLGSAPGLLPFSTLLFLEPGSLATVNLTLGTTTGGGGGGTSGTGPVISSINPDNGTTNADIKSLIIITFDQAVRSSTLTTHSVILTRITTPQSVDDSGCSTIIPFVGLTNTFIYIPGGLDTSATKQCPANPNTETLAPKTKYVVTVNNRLLGSNGLPSPGSSKTFTTRDQGGGTGGGTSLSAPKLIFENPGNGQSNVDPGTLILFGFDSPVITSTVTVTSNNIILARLTPPASNDLAGNVVPVTTPVPLANTFQYIPGPGFMTVGTTYSLFVTNKIIGQNGIPEKGESFSFTTRTQNSAATGPVVISRNPAAGQTNVATDTRILLTFDRPINPLSLTTGSAITLNETTPTVQTVNTTLSLLTNPLNTVEVHPVLGTGPSAVTTNLNQSSGYQVTVTNRILDQQGNPAKGDAYSFTTKAVSGSGGSGGGGIVVPHLLSSNPSDLSSNVDVNTRILLTFDVPMILSTLQQANSVILTQITSPSSDLQTCITASSLQNTFVVQPVIPGSSCSPTPVSTSLHGNQKYRVFLSNSIQASGSNGGFLNPKFITFTTRNISGGCGDTSSPVLAGSNPTAGQKDVDINVKIIFSFNKPVQVSTVTTDSVVLTQVTTPASRDSAAPAPTPLDATSTTLACNPTVSVSVATEFQYNPGSLKLTPGITFEVFLTNAILDLAGNHLIPANFSFTTANVQTIPQGPRLASSDPTDKSTNNDASSVILFTFDKDIFAAADDRPLDPLVFDTAPVSLTVPAGLPAYPQTPGWTVNPTSTFLARITIPASDDITANITQSFAILSGKFAGTYVARQGPMVFRPDPVNFPRTFEYIPGKLHLQDGVNRYSVFITDAVKDAQGNASPGATFAFTTRPSVSTPGQGPRLLNSNPEPGQFTSVNAPVYLVFDKPVLQLAYLAGGRLFGQPPPPGMQPLGSALFMNQIWNAQNASSCFSAPTLCDLRTIDPGTCLCELGSANLFTGFSDASPTVGAPPETVILCTHGSLNLTNGAVTGTVYITINGFLLSDGQLTGDGLNLPAPGDSTFWFGR